MIMLSQVEISFKVDHLFGLLSYWSVSSNVFIFPWGLMMPNPSWCGGYPWLAHDAPIASLGFHFTKSTSSYDSFMAYNVVASSDVSDVEHNTFYLHWFNMFFICTGSITRVQELQLYVALLQSNKSIVWGYLFISSFCRSFPTILERLREMNDINIVNGPIWFL